MASTLTTDGLHDGTVTEVSKRKLFIEYVMLNGVNDHFEHAHQLADLLQGYRSFVNLM